MTCFSHPFRVVALSVWLPAALLLFAASSTKGTEARDYAAYVNPFVGTAGHGHTFPGATRPFGMVQVSPDTRVSGWDACAGYHYSDGFIHGFSHTHLSGVGIQDYCDVLVMPEAGQPTLVTPDPAAGVRGYGSRFSHSQETAEPGYYSVRLEDPSIDVELTATPRVAFHRYSFPSGRERSLVIDLAHFISVQDARLEVVSPTEIVGYRRTSAWAKDKAVYFVARFERPIAACVLSDGDAPSDKRLLVGRRLKALVTLENGEDPVQFKVALSFVSIEGARRNLEAELPGWAFDVARKKARDEWNTVLGRVDADSREPSVLRTFYTALYHCYLCPSVFSDVDGSYLGRDGRVHEGTGSYYTVFSLWDTHRAWHPLMSLLEPGITQEFIRTFLLMYRQGGLLPVWDLAGNETFCMNGYHAVSVIADAYAKGLRDFDAELALSAMEHSANQEHFGLGAYRRNGYISKENGREGVARTLEYAYDDWCIGRFAAALGRTTLAEDYYRRSLSYRHLFNPSARFFVGRENGAWCSPFNPKEINFNYTEGNAWQYRFSAPHDISGLVSLYGGDAAFGAALDALFNESSQLEGREQADVTGLIGQYVQGNEPDHHAAYLYDYIGRPAETQRRVREICSSLYSDKPDGLCGNEDCGQMSAWYVLSMIGFYQVTPGLPRYALGSPGLDRVSLDVGGGRRFVIRVSNQSPNHPHIASIALNGRPLERCYLDHHELVEGGELSISLGEKPRADWAVHPEQRPDARVPDSGFVVAPTIRVPISFSSSATVTLKPGAARDELWFTLDGTTPIPGSATLYSTPFTIRQSCTIKVIGRHDGHTSPVVVAEAHQSDLTMKVSVANPISAQYTAGGPQALVDGVLGGPDFTTGRWQGYEGCDMDVVVDMGKESSVHKVTVGFLQSSESYVFYPSWLVLYESLDGRTWRRAHTGKVPETPRDTNRTTIDRISVPLSCTTRYLRIVASNPGPVPAWGSVSEMVKSFLFCDEIQVDHD